ncbi:MAG: hypothetical protein C0407_17450 [Desulfobacca sp.]|nr:hypothetical protein [Desulfobacca sp.]
MTFQKPLIQEKSKIIFPTAIPNIFIQGGPVSLKAGSFRDFQVPRLKRTVDQSWETKNRNFFVPHLRISHKKLLNFYFHDQGHRFATRLGPSFPFKRV